ncbi:hypothetical protein K488DRAFT_47898 [Vararia minispora EC-137]|uniref:Uncharacterized protein n=1 Tax=Vararia minispora EC-137 TaxID=1314806 RepID=A0ACB8QN97_9AGAM|nr:hypothetical protein K488DRAFT_47898 [Vararia minispora EC-137]
MAKHVAQLTSARIVSCLSGQGSRVLLSSFRRHNTTGPSPTPSPKPRRIAAFTLTVFAGLTAAYFFWPDRHRGAPTIAHQPLSPTYFTPLTVIASEPCGPSLKLLTLHVPLECLPSTDDPTFPLPIWSIYVKDDDIQVERPYTPLEGIDADGNIKLWVKKYQHGEVGRWLHTKKPEDQIEVRGPLITLPTHGKDWEEVVLISGGTGFSPFYQLLHHSLLQDLSPDKQTRYTLIHCSRTQDELPPSQYLQPLLEYAERYPERLRLHLFVDDFPEKPRYDLKRGKIGTQEIQDCIGLPPGGRQSWLRLPWSPQGDFRRDGKILVAVCGPEPMIAAVAGPYGRNYSQGSVGGALAQLGFKLEEIYKL